jgi:hypothetical protein
MKLIYCKECDDVVRLLDEVRQCRCGRCTGRYKPESESHAEFSGPCVPFALSNRTFKLAVDTRNEDRVVPFLGWVPIINDPKFGMMREDGP